SCNVAAESGDGQALLDQLAALTGADVFASNDLTGAHGDWNLEAASAGDADELAAGIDTVLDVEELADYTGTLAAPVIHNGDYVIVYQGVDADGKGVFAQRYDVDGNTLGAEFQVNTSTAGDQKAPVMERHTDGSFVIVWQGVDAGKSGVYGQRYDAAGNTAGAEFLVNTSTAGDQKTPGIEMHTDGSFVVVWEGVDADGDGVYFQRYDATGNTLGGETLVNTSTAGDQNTPGIEMHTDGSFVVVWEGVDADKNGVYGQR
ncbi:unnamed protein product, partial [marine sediment metagenome]